MYTCLDKACTLFNTLINSSTTLYRLIKTCFNFILKIQYTAPIIPKRNASEVCLCKTFIKDVETNTHHFQHDCMGMVTYNLDTRMKEVSRFGLFNKTTETLSSVYNLRIQRRCMYHTFHLTVTIHQLIDRLPTCSHYEPNSRLVRHEYLDCGTIRMVKETSIVLSFFGHRSDTSDYNFEVPSLKSKTCVAPEVYIKLLFTQVFRKDSILFGRVGLLNTSLDTVIRIGNSRVIMEFGIRGNFTCKVLLKFDILEYTLDTQGKTTKYSFPKKLYEHPMVSLQLYE